MPKAKRQSLYYAAFRCGDNYQEVELYAKSDRAALREAKQLLKTQYENWEMEVWRRVE